LRRRRQIIAGGFHCPDSAQRHQALFGLGALFAEWLTLIQRVTCFGLPPSSGCRPYLARGVL